MSSRRLQDMSPRRLQDMPSRRLEDIFSIPIFRLPRRLEEVLKMSSTCLARGLENVFKTFSRRIQNVLEDVKLLRSRRVEDVFKTSWRPTSFLGFKSSGRGLQDIFMKTSCGYVLKDKKMLYWRRLQYVFTKTNVWWVSLSGLSVVVCSLILHHKHSRHSSNLCWSLHKATSCEHNNSKYGQGKSGPTSQSWCVQTICNKYTTQHPLPARQHWERMEKEIYSALWSIRLGAVINQAN